MNYCWILKSTLNFKCLGEKIEKFKFIGKTMLFQNPYLISKSKSEVYHDLFSSKFQTKQNLDVLRPPPFTYLNDRQ